MCTEFILPKSTGFYISGRTMDFKQIFNWQLASIPVGTDLKAVPTLFSGRHALEWQAKYGFLGVGAKFAFSLFDKKVTDAMNTEGFSAAALWLPGSVYPTPKDAPTEAKLVSALDICSWAVSNYRTVADLKADLSQIQQGKPIATGEQIGFWDPLQFGAELTFNQEVTNLAPLHFQFHDKHGDSLVLEFRNGKLELTDNSDLGVMTNAPFIDWQRANLQNYLGVTNTQEKTKNILGLTVSSAGNGSGTIGLSSSPLPADRFVRTVMNLDFSQKWLQAQSGDANAAISHVMNVIAAVTVLHGQCIDHAGDTTGDFTQWRVVRDHAQQKLYFATAGSFGYWAINFKDFKLSAGAQPAFVLLSDAVDMPVLTAG